MAAIRFREGDAAGPNDKPQYDGSYINDPPTATVKLRLHCLDGTYYYLDLSWPQQVRVFERNNEINAPPSVEGGQPLQMEIFVTDDAPPSNYRIDLVWGGSGLAPLGPRPDYVDVVAGHKSVAFSIPATTIPQWYERGEEFPFALR